MKKIISIIILSLLALVSCGVKQEVMISLEGGGGLILDVALDEVFVNYLFDIAEATTDIENPDELQIFDLPEIKRSLEEKPGIKMGKIESKDVGSLHMELVCSDLNALSQSLSKGEQRIFSFTEVNGRKVFKFNLSKAGYSDIKKLFPFLDNPVFENLAPKADETITRKEYLEILEFAMEEEGVAAALKSVLLVQIKTGGKIFSQKGGTLKNGVLVLEIPLLDVLLLNDPLEYEVVFK